MQDLTLEVKKIKRCYCITMGESILGRFKSEKEANERLEEDRKFYEYWSGSASVSVENTPPKIIEI